MIHQDQLDRIEGLLRELLHLERERQVAEETEKFRQIVNNTPLTDDIYALLEAQTTHRIKAIRAGKLYHQLIE